MRAYTHTHAHAQTLCLSMMMITTRIELKSGRNKRFGYFSGVFLLTTKNAFVLVEHVVSVNTYLRISTVLWESERSEWATSWKEQASEESVVKWSAAEWVTDGAFKTWLSLTRNAPFVYLLRNRKKSNRALFQMHSLKTAAEFNNHSHLWIVERYQPTEQWAQPLINAHYRT